MTIGPSRADQTTVDGSMERGLLATVLDVLRTTSCERKE